MNLVTAVVVEMSVRKGREESESAAHKALFDQRVAVMVDDIQMQAMGPQRVVEVALANTYELQCTLSKAPKPATAGPIGAWMWKVRRSRSTFCASSCAPNCTSSV